ncbi:MAG: hypothetical protein CL565_05040 [Alphaproteobacteria bacterium]|nr:hypothetical protein [Alphaproteobacteria bacterium]|tara:strand:- start:648 stop:869 length:222 start_codon:yes stop_codon:yes gene_type:complete
MDTKSIIAETDALRARFTINSERSLLGMAGVNSVFSPGEIPSQSERIILEEACKTLPPEQGERAMAFLKNLDI